MSTSELYAADVDHLVRVLDDARSDEPGPAMPWALLEGVQRLVPCDVEINYQHHEQRLSPRTCGPAARSTAAAPPASPGPGPAAGR